MADNEATCPHCNKVIENVDFIERDVMRFGTCWLDGDNLDFDFKDSEGSDDYTFECPHCTEELGNGDEDELKEILKGYSDLQKVVKEKIEQNGKK